MCWSGSSFCKWHNTAFPMQLRKLSFIIRCSWHYLTRVEVENCKPTLFCIRNLHDFPMRGNFAKIYRRKYLKHWRDSKVANFSCHEPFQHQQIVRFQSCELKPPQAVKASANYESFSSRKLIYSMLLSSVAKSGSFSRKTFWWNLMLVLLWIQQQNYVYICCLSIYLRC